MSALDGFEHERLIVRRGARSGVELIVAIHSTVLGPALGGARMWHYPSLDDAVADALRLSAAMTRKAAVAGLALGGGKAVLALPGERRPSGAEREAILLDFGDLVDSVGGVYITAEDVGTQVADMAMIGTRTRHVAGRSPADGGSGDPSGVTALGVLAAIHACAAARLGTRRLAGMRIAVVGLGAVGSRLAELLGAEGCELLAGDTDPGRRAFASELGARWVEPGELLSSPCEVLAPCALGGMITGEVVGSLRCSVICGAANNVLADPGVADELAARAILYAPDFIVNAGGLINVYGELNGYSRERACELAAGIEKTLTGVLETARRDGLTPAAAAEELAQRRIVARRGRAAAITNGAVADPAGAATLR